MKLKKSISLILACLLVSASFAACKKTEDGETTGDGTGETNEPEITIKIGDTDVGQYIADGYFTEANEAYAEACSAIYDSVLGDFNTSYQTAKEEVENVSLRYALMAVAEAKLLESAVMLPSTCDGGNYAVSRVAPYTGNYANWGNDNERYHNVIVTTEFITTEDRNEMKAKWNEIKGTGTYAEWATEFLTSKGYTIKDSYTSAYTSDPKTWDVLATSRAADSEMIIQTYDGLLEYDCEGILQPALATSLGEFETQADGTVTVTYHIREGVKWVDSQGREVADLKADDFVAGMQHMCDTEGGLEYLVQGVIVNVDEYIKDEITDFSQVGVTAVDDYTLVYTLTGPCTYFETMLGYGVFAPMSRDYYTSQGGKFGAEFDNSVETYLYGTTPDNIAYCGPFLVTNNTPENTIVFTENPSYWNKDNTTIKTYTRKYNDGSDTTKNYTDAVAGTIDGTGLNASTLTMAREDGNFDKYGYTSLTGSSSYMGFINVFRNSYANTNDTSTVTSQLANSTEEHRSMAAMGNEHFRRAICFSVDRASYNAQKVGEDLKLTSLRNSYTPGTFVFLQEETTISINGTDKTYPAGTAYGEIMQDQLDADGVKIKVWDAENSTGDGFDGWYNVENAKAELELAIEELASQGVVIDENNPIYFEIPYPSNSETYTNAETAVKQSIDNALGGKVIVNLVECVNYDEWYYAGYWTEYGYEANYSFYDLSGWGPDYGDPSTYLDTFLPDGAGYMAKCIGLY